MMKLLRLLQCYNLFFDVHFVFDFCTLVEVVLFPKTDKFIFAPVGHLYFETFLDMIALRSPMNISKRPSRYWTRAHRKKNIVFVRLFTSLSSILYIGLTTRCMKVSSFCCPVTYISACVKAHVSSLTDQ